MSAYAVPRAIARVDAGLIDLAHHAITELPLAAVNDAVVHAAANAGPFKMTVLRP